MQPHGGKVASRATLAYANPSILLTIKNSNRRKMIITIVSNYSKIQVMIVSIGTHLQHM